MPVIKSNPRGMGNRMVTEFVDSVGTTEVAFSIPDNVEQDTLTIYNISPVGLILNVGSQTNVAVPAYREVILNEDFTSFTIKSTFGVGGFRATCSYEDFDEEDEKTLSDKLNSKVDKTYVDTQLSAKAAQSDLDTTTQNVATLTTQLADNSTKVTQRFSKNNTNRLPTLNVSANKKIKPLVTFIDDDGNAALLTKLKPLSEKYNVPFVIALVSDFVQTGSGVTAVQALDLQNNLGWEIASHSKSHLGLSTPGTTEAQMESETRDSAEYLRSQGLDVKSFVYPGGQHDVNSRRIVSKYYNSGISTDLVLNKSPLKTYQLGRFGFPQSAPNNTLAWCKAKVDEAVSNNAWLIWMTHVGQADMDATQTQILDDLIAYIKSINVDIVTVQGGLDIIGNIVGINDNQFYIGADGENNMVNYIAVKNDVITGLEGINADMTPSDFKLNKTYTSKILSPTEKAKFPKGGAGIFIVVMTDWINNSYQKYVDVDKNVFIRYYASNTSWGPWKPFYGGTLKQTATLNVTVPANSFANSNISLGTYSQNKLGMIKPQAKLPNGLIFSQYTAGLNGTIEIIFQNLTASPITLTDSLWDYVIMDMI